MKKVLVCGTFDILHPGHVHVLKEAKKYGDYLVVVISRDETVKSLKKKRPTFDEHTRLKRVDQLGIADRVRLGNLQDKHQVIREEDPDVMALGYDQHFLLDDLENALKESAQIVRIGEYMPEVYKSSKLSADYVLPPEVLDNEI